MLLKNRSILLGEMKAIKCVFHCTKQSQDGKEGKTGDVELIDMIETRSDQEQGAIAVRGQAVIKAYGVGQHMVHIAISLRERK